jgi:hypothetical protein
LNQSALDGQTRTTGADSLSPSSSDSRPWSKAPDLNFDFDFNLGGLNNESTTPPSSAAEDPRTTSRPLLQIPASDHHLKAPQQKQSEQTLEKQHNLDRSLTTHRNQTRKRAPAAAAKTAVSRENNRLAAAKVRARKKKHHEQIDKLYHDADRLRSLLKRNVAELREQLLQLRTLALQHQGCCCSSISLYNKERARLVAARRVA